MKDFALIGVGGFIAPRHLFAIKETGNRLVAAMDIHDSVGVIDNFFPDANFFTEFERFARHLEKLRRDGHGVDYLVVCSPNYLHDFHVRYGLGIDVNVICEKPLVVNPWNLVGIREAEEKSEGKVNTILQMRLHPVVDEIRQAVTRTIDNVEIVYNAPRGKWYDVSWKADESKSGGLIYNIGIHFLDLMCLMCGKAHKSEITIQTSHNVVGTTWYDDAVVNWYLSIDQNEPKRIIKVNDESFDCTSVFADLHTKSYQRILQGEGFGIDDAEPSICLAYSIRHGELSNEYICSQYGNCG